MNHEEWITRAKNTIEQKLPVGASFELKQLFPGHEWEALSKSDRISLGIRFSKCINDGDLPNVTRFGNGKTRHNRYIKQAGDSADEQRSL